MVLWERRISSFLLPCYVYNNYGTHFLIIKYCISNVFPSAFLMTIYDFLIIFLSR